MPRYASVMIELLHDLQNHLWLAAAAIVVGIAARLAKDDTKVPFFNIPSRWQPVFVLGLSVLYAAIQDAIAGAPWQTAVKDAAAIAVVSMGAFDILVKALLNGKDLPAWATPILKNFEVCIEQEAQLYEDRSSPTSPKDDAGPAA